MRRVSFGWYVVLIVWLITGVIFIIVNNKLKLVSVDDSNLILGIISVAVSIVSLGLATMNHLGFNGDVLCWVNPTQKHEVNNDTHGKNKKGVYDWVSFKIQNKNKEAIKSLVVNFRFPDNIYFERRQDQMKSNCLVVKNTVIYTSDLVSFLGINQGDCELVFEHLIKISEVKGSYIYITIAGSNIRPTTFKINNEIAKLISVSDSKNPIKLSKV